MFARWIALIVVMFALTGCGAKLAYNNLSLITDWYIDDYIQLNEQQQAIFDRHLTQLQNWHRTEELPAYRELFESIHRHLQQPEVDPQFLQQKISRLRGHWSALIQQATPAVIELSLTLSPAQRSRFIEALEERNVKRLKRADSAAEHQQESVKDIEKWMGQLTRQQRNWVEQYAAQNPDMTAATVAAHRAFQAQLAELLEQPTHPNFEVRMERLLADALGATPEGQRLTALREAQLQSRVALFVNLWRSASDNQKRKVRSRLQGYIDDIDDLIEG